MGGNYYQQILGWDWKYIVEHAEDGKDEEGNPIKSTYLGSSLNLTPSGKFYMPWSTNVTEKEAQKDEAWFAALDKVASKFGGWIQNGEGDACDLYFVRTDA